MPSDEELREELSQGGRLLWQRDHTSEVLANGAAARVDDLLAEVRSRLSESDMRSE